MVSLGLFTAIWGRKKQTRRVESDLFEADVEGSDAGCSTRLFPLDSSPEDYDPAVANDFSYEDALLDSHIRVFMRDEYGRVTPPEGTFQRLMRVLRNEAAAKARQAHWTSPLERLFVGLYRAFNGQTLSRMVPSGIAVAVLIVVGIGSSTSGLLQSGQLDRLMSSTPESTQVVSTIFMPSPDQQPMTIIHTQSGSTQTSVDITGGEEAYILIRGGIAYNLPTDKMRGIFIETTRVEKNKLTPF